VQRFASSCVTTSFEIIGFPKFFSLVTISDNIVCILSCSACSSKTHETIPMMLGCFGDMFPTDKPTRLPGGSMRAVYCCHCNWICVVVFQELEVSTEVQSASNSKTTPVQVHVHELVESRGWSSMHKVYVRRKYIIVIYFASGLVVSCLL
jgi:hypothetical protein